MTVHRDLHRFQHWRMSSTAQRRVLGERPRMADFLEGGQPAESPDTPPVVLASTPQQIMEAVAVASSLTMEALLDPGKYPEAAHPRMVACALMRRRSGLDLKIVAGFLDRARGTVQGLTQRGEHLIEHDEAMKRVYERALMILDGPGRPG